MGQGFGVQIGVCWCAQGGKPYRQRAPHEPRRGGVKLLGLVGEPEPVSSVTLVEMSSSQKSRALLARPRGAGYRSGEGLLSPSPRAKSLWLLCTERKPDSSPWPGRRGGAEGPARSVPAEPGAASAPSVARTRHPFAAQGVAWAQGSWPPADRGRRCLRPVWSARGRMQPQLAEGTVPGRRRDPHVFPAAYL